MPVSEPFRRTCLAILIGQFLATPAPATVISVDSTDDTTTTDGNCTLREAVISANTGASDDCALGSGAETDFIQFINIALPATITLTGSQLSITDDVNIFAAGSNFMTVTADDGSRIFYISDAAVSLSSMTLTNGSVTDLGGAIYAKQNSTVSLTGATVSSSTAYYGGCIFADNSTVTLNNSTVSGCTAYSNGGGIYAQSANITLTNSASLMDNAAAATGGGIDAQGASVVSISNSTISGNTGTNGGGLGVGNTSTLTLTSSATVTGNSAIAAGGGIFTRNAGATATITNSTISNNTSDGDGGGITVYDASAVTLDGAVVSGNSAADFGGGIEVVSASLSLVNGTTVSGNQGGRGGGISGFYTSSSATVPVSLSIDASTISGNSATGSSIPQMRGGGVYLSGGGFGTLSKAALVLSGGSILSDNTASLVGGGLYAKYSSSVSLANCTVSGNFAAGSAGINFRNLWYATVDSCTVSNNTASGGTGGMSMTQGIYFEMNNCTISGNTANTYAGGIFTSIGGPFNIVNSTITGNSATTGIGGGIFFQNPYTLSLLNSVISGNRAGGSGSEVYLQGGPLLPTSGNLFGDSGITTAQAFGGGFAPAPGDRVATSDGAHLRPLNAILDTTLADNGGATFTHALVSGSPAIDAGNNAACPAHDQRGEPRNDGACDAGSFESPFGGGTCFTAITQGGQPVVFCL